MGVESFTENVSQGNIGAAVLDGVGIIADAAAVALPLVPGGAGAAIKGARAVDKAVDAVSSASKAENVVRGSSKARFLGDVDGKLIDTQATPKGSYIQPDGSRTDVLQDKPHLNKIGKGKVENVGTSHTHNKGQNIDKEGKVHEFIEDKAHVPTYEEVTNISNGIAKKKKNGKKD